MGSPSIRSPWLSVLPLVLWALLPGCRAPSAAKGALAADSAAHPSAARRGSGPHLERSASSTRSRSARARLYLEAARAHLEGGDAPAALRCAHLARRLRSDATFRASCYRVIGEAHLTSGHASLAERYLIKGLERASEPERQATLARLAVSLEAQGRRDEAAACRQQLVTPVSADIARILASRVPAVPAPSIAPEPVRARRAPAENRGGTRRRAPAAAPEAGPIQVLSRSSWNATAVAASRATPMGRIDKVTIHHSASPEDFDGITRWDAAEEIRRIQRYHQKQRGWADIGYHYVIDRRGEVWQGRSLAYQGAHASGPANRGNIGIVLLGNYSPNRQRLTAAQRQSLALLTAMLCEYFGIPAGRVYTHEEIRPGHTACPGPEIGRFVRKVRQFVEERQVARGTPGARAAPVALERR